MHKTALVLQKYCVNENISAFRNILLSPVPRKRLVDELIVVLGMIYSHIPACYRLVVMGY